MASEEFPHEECFEGTVLKFRDQLSEIKNEGEEDDDSLQSSTALIMKFNRLSMQVPYVLLLDM